MIIPLTPCRSAWSRAIPMLEPVSCILTLSADKPGDLWCGSCTNLATVAVLFGSLQHFYRRPAFTTYNLTDQVKLTFKDNSDK